MSLIEIKQHALASAKGTEMMDEQMQKQAKKDIMDLTSGFKSAGSESMSIDATR